MSTTLLRLGLWILLLTLAGYVIRESVDDAHLVELLNDELLRMAGIVGVASILVGVIVGIFQKLAKKAIKTRCRVCGRPIPHGQTYCRPHLREILDEEDRTFHSTKIRGR
jgi:hypothetical protein